MLKRKIYDELVAWKSSSNGTTAMMIDGARRVGKSYIAEAFAKAEYKSYILIDFGRAPTDVLDLFANDSSDLRKTRSLLCNASPQKGIADHF